MSETVKREGLAAVPWAWIAFWLALAGGHVAAALIAPESPALAVRIGCPAEEGVDLGT